MATPTYIRIGDTLDNIIDSATGERVTYNKVTTWSDGTPMDDSKTDGVIYRKLGSEYFKRVFNDGIVSIKWWGAKGNAILEEGVYTGTDDTIAIQAAFSWLRQGYKLLIPEGKYLISSNINLLSKSKVDVEFIGDLVTNNASGLNIQNVFYSNIINYGCHNSTKIENTRNAAVRIQDSRVCNFSFRDVLNYRFGIHLEPVAGGIAYNQFTGGRIAAAQYHIFFDNTRLSSTGSYINENTFTSLNLATGNYVDSHGIYAPVPTGVFSTNNNRFISCTLENLPFGIKMGTKGTGFAVGWTFIGMRAENVTGYHIEGYTRGCTSIGGVGFQDFREGKIDLDSTNDRYFTWLGGYDHLDNEPNYYTSHAVHERLGGFSFIDNSFKRSSYIAKIGAVQTPSLFQPAGNGQQIFNKQYNRALTTDPTTKYNILGTFDVGAVIWNTDQTLGTPFAARIDVAGTQVTTQLTGVLGTGTTGTNNLTLSGTTNTSIVNGTYITVGGDKYRVGYRKGNVLTLSSNLTSTYTNATVLFSNDIQATLLGQFVPANKLRTDPIDGGDLIGDMQAGAISRSTNNVSTGYPSASGETWTFNGAFSGLNEKDRVFSFYKPKINTGDRFYIQHYNPDGSGQGFKGIQYIEAGTTAQRPIAINRIIGQLYFNTELSILEVWDGTGFRHVEKTATLTDLGVVLQAPASLDSAANVGATYSQAEVQAILTELRDLKTKLRASGVLAP